MPGATGLPLRLRSEVSAGEHGFSSLGWCRKYMSFEWCGHLHPQHTGTAHAMAMVRSAIYWTRRLGRRLPDR
jgi:hypothetical protein